MDPQMDPAHCRDSCDHFAITSSYWNYGNLRELVLKTPHTKMIKHVEITDADLRKQIRQQEINFGGNLRLKIYGHLHCASGKRMKRQNRVFFRSEKEARQNGFRPCGHCMKKEYSQWKTGI